jgi:hypothetical protein
MKRATYTLNYSTFLENRLSVTVHGRPIVLRSYISPVTLKLSVEFVIISLRVGQSEGPNPNQTVSVHPVNAGSGRILDQSQHGIRVHVNPTLNLGGLLAGL